MRTVTSRTEARAERASAQSGRAVVLWFDARVVRTRTPRKDGREEQRAREADNETIAIAAAMRRVQLPPMAILAAVGTRRVVGGMFRRKGCCTPRSWCRTRVVSQRRGTVAHGDANGAPTDSQSCEPQAGHS